MNPTTVPPASAPDPDRARFYEEDARWYAAHLRPEEYMESTTQATQREITLESFALVRRVRPEVQCFNELLIHYPVAGQRQPGRVIPDNFVVVHPANLGRITSFAIDLQPVRPLLVLEYVSKHNPRKDYEDNLVRYEQVLRVPYYLLFYPDNEELTLFRLAGGKYQSARPNDAGRVAVPELEMEVAIAGGWVRFWFRGELLALPAELADRVVAAEQRATTAEARAATAEVRVVAAEQERDAERAARLAVEVELARLREQITRGAGG